MHIIATEQVSSDCMKVETDGAPVFFMRTVYLSTLAVERIHAGEELDEEAALDLLDASLAFAAEKKALDYLARREHSRKELERKLLQKGMQKAAVFRALDYLEARRFLSDERFAESWLRTHTLTKAQGRSRLLSELLSRGVSREIAGEALDAFFAEHDADALCERAVEKALRVGKRDEKLVQSLLQSGFTYRQIKQALSAWESKNCGEMLINRLTCLSADRSVNLHFLVRT